MASVCFGHLFFCWRLASVLVLPLVDPASKFYCCFRASVVFFAARPRGIRRIDPSRLCIRTCVQKKLHLAEASSRRFSHVAWDKEPQEKGGCTLGCSPRCLLKVEHGKVGVVWKRPPNQLKTKTQGMAGNQALGGCLSPSENKKKGGKAFRGLDF